jgi:hypothetical protein
MAAPLRTPFLAAGRLRPLQVELFLGGESMPPPPAGSVGWSEEYMSKEGAKPDHGELPSLLVPEALRAPKALGTIGEVVIDWVVNDVYMTIHV